MDSAICGYMFYGFGFSHTCSLPSGHWGDHKARFDGEPIESAAPESQSQRERDQVFYSREYCRNCGHKHGSGPCGWDAGAGMCSCLEFVDKGLDWPGQPKQGCCAARKALPGIRQCVYDIGYAISTVDQRSSGECVYVMELIDEALAAPCECDQLRAQLAAKDALLVEARQDTARLDWREANPKHGFGLYADGTWADGCGGSHLTYRAAVDAAMSTKESA